MLERNFSPHFHPRSPRTYVFNGLDARGSIRDKIAASKKKGMWMGGVPPLGYRVADHKLAAVDSEAEIVRLIFRRYAELGSVRLLNEELEARSIKSKAWTTAFECAP
jgi:DNA invertase Pin-like site-specific DNA recombinase